MRPPPAKSGHESGERNLVCNVGPLLFSRQETFATVKELSESMHPVVQRAFENAQAVPATCHERLYEAGPGTGFDDGVAPSRKGTFATFGAFRQSEFLSEVEKLAEKGVLVRCCTRLGDLQQEYERVESALRMIPSTSWVLPLERA